MKTCFEFDSEEIVLPLDTCGETNRRLIIRECMIKVTKPTGETCWLFEAFSFTGARHSQGGWSNLVEDSNTEVSNLKKCFSSFDKILDERCSESLEWTRNLARRYRTGMGNVNLRKVLKSECGFVYTGFWVNKMYSKSTISGLKTVFIQLHLLGALHDCARRDFNDDQSHFCPSKGLT